MPGPLNGVKAGTVYHFTALGGVFLSDVSEPFQGNFTVWPGTHRALAAHFAAHGTDELLQGFPRIAMPAPRQLTARAGDAILAHYQLAHGAAPNVGPHVRYAVFFRLARQGTTLVDGDHGRHLARMEWARLRSAAAGVIASGAMNSKRLVRLLAWVVTAGLLVLLFRKIPFQQVVAATRAAAPWTVPAALLCAVAVYLGDSFAIWKTFGWFLTRLSFGDVLLVRARPTCWPPSTTTWAKARSSTSCTASRACRSCAGSPRSSSSWGSTCWRFCS